MAKRNVVWTKTADIQFSGILEYWVKRNKSNAYSRKLVRLVSEKAEQIAKNPYICKPSDFADTRVASLKHFSIYYKVTDTQIIISAFWDNRQDPKKLLEILQN
ncbi:MAG: type II toxin-antitoxin system RelE/ParE family toxin [Agriterribacter sp.]